MAGHKPNFACSHRKLEDARDRFSPGTGKSVALLYLDFEILVSRTVRESTSGFLGFGRGVFCLFFWGGVGGQSAVLVVHCTKQAFPRCCMLRDLIAVQHV